MNQQQPPKSPQQGQGPRPGKKRRRRPGGGNRGGQQGATNHRDPNQPGQNREPQQQRSQQGNPRPNNHNKPQNPNHSQNKSHQNQQSGSGRSRHGSGGQQGQQQAQIDNKNPLPVPLQRLKPHEFKKTPHLPQQAKPLRYAVFFYDTFVQAKSDLESLKSKKETVDQLNIVIRAEGDMDDPDLTPYGKVFAGAAWALIHERRQQEGWYETTH